MALEPKYSTASKAADFAPAIAEFVKNSDHQYHYVYDRTVDSRDKSAREELTLSLPHATLYFYSCVPRGSGYGRADNFVLFNEDQPDAAAVLFSRSDGEDDKALVIHNSAFVKDLTRQLLGMTNEPTCQPEPRPLAGAAPP